MINIIIQCVIMMQKERILEDRLCVQKRSFKFHFNINFDNVIY